MFEVGDLVRVRTRDMIAPNENYVQDTDREDMYYGLSKDTLEGIRELGFLNVKRVINAHPYGGYFINAEGAAYILDIPDEEYWFDPEFLENMLESEAESSSGEDLPDPDPESLSEFLAWEVSV